MTTIAPPPPGALPHSDAQSVIRTLPSITRSDVAQVGGKGANLGEMLGADLPVPPAFVVTVDAYRQFCDANGLAEQRLLLDRARI